MYFAGTCSYILTFKVVKMRLLNGVNLFFPVSQCVYKSVKVGVICRSFCVSCNMCGYLKCIPFVYRKARFLKPEPLLALSVGKIHHQENNSKGITGSFPSVHNPKIVEEKWYEWWEKNNIFVPKVSSEDAKVDDKSPVFSMILPPPNITGNLHLGHTLTVAIQDSLTRWHRMNGDAVVWIPGYDHGGIATQVLVEKKLWKERKLTKYQLGKEQFLNEVMKWKTSKQQEIEKQLKKLGSSLDFTRSSFTMDSATSEAVIAAFIQLFEENLIYRKERMVNWSCEIQSVISDIEVDHIAVPESTKIRVPGCKEPISVGILESFYYPIADSDERLVVATTRLETILGDSAVAVNPSDDRYAKWIGRSVINPLTEEILPIIADSSVNKEFGTGVMKVTPAHDFKDFELSRKHSLPLKDILCDDGTIKGDIKTFGGKHRFLARKLIRENLLQRGLYVKKQAHPTNIPVCSRTGDIVEPRLKLQWYLDLSSMTAAAIKAVEDGHLKLIPEYYGKVWLEWLLNTKEWCISRQLWWGHTIPLYQINHSNEKGQELWVAARNEKEAIIKGAQKLNVGVDTITAKQDSDVLDTWFSSALFPLSALGWPKKVEDMKMFYPLSMMETGHDIIFFWVARMVMLGQHLTGKLPFNTVLFHGMICDAHGRKMTKSLGNVIDPLDIIQGITLEGLCKRATDSYEQGYLTPEELKLALDGQKRSFPKGIPECGSDSLRFALLSRNIQNQQINIDLKEIRACKHFCNKIWQGTRFFTKAIEKCSRKVRPLSPSRDSIDSLSEVDQWILSCLSHMVGNCNKGFSSYNFHLTTSSIHHFWIQEFCDVYLEYVKPVLKFEDEDNILVACEVMLTCIETFLRAISPIMPFLAEDLYQRLMQMTSIETSLSIGIAQYPNTKQLVTWRNTVLEAEMKTVEELINIIRSLKTRHGATKTKPNVIFAVDGQLTLSTLERFASLIAALSQLESVTFHLTQGQEFFELQPTDTWVSQSHDHGITVLMDINKDKNAEEAAGSGMKNRLEDIHKELENLSRMVSDVGYRKKAPLSVRESHLAKKASLEAKLQRPLNQQAKDDHEKQEDSSGF